MIWVTLTTWIFCLSLPGLFPADSATVSVDMMVTTGGFVELYLNDLSRPPLAQPLTPGVRRTYIFPNVSEDVTLLRLDPTEAPAAEVQLFSVQVTDAQGTLASFTPVMLSQWSRSNLTP